MILSHQTTKWHINQNFEKFMCKPQSACYACLFVCMTSLTSRQHLIIQKFPKQP